MDVHHTGLKFRIFRVGPKNQKLDGALEPCAAPISDEYRALVESDLPLSELLELTSIEIPPEEQQKASEIFQYANEGKIERTFELFEFTKRADYGRDGVDEYFVRDRLQFFGFRPATFVELLCFGRTLRRMYENHWFESKSILSLGSVVTTTQIIRKKSWLGKEIAETCSYYPELVCVAGRPLDQIKLSTTEKNKHGNWPNEVLFLATRLP